MAVSSCDHRKVQQSHLYLCAKLTMPFGPRVLFTTSAIAIAPTKDAYSGVAHLLSFHIHSCDWEMVQIQKKHTSRAFSPFSSVAPCARRAC